MKTRSLILNKYTLMLFAAVAVTAGYAWWSAKHKTAAAQRYETQAIAYGDLTQTVSANGTLNPVVLVNVGTQVSGTVKRLYADFNERVKAGQALLELDDALLKAQLGQSQANLASARATLDLANANEDRARTLFAKEYISRQELDAAIQAKASAAAQVAQVSAQVEKDRTNLGYTIIRSPVSGVVVDREVDVGQTVAASFQTPTLFKIAQDLRHMQIDSSFAEADVGNIKTGQPVRFTVDAFPSRAFKGTVKQVRLNPTTQQNVVTYDVVVAVENPEQILMPGMTAYVNVVVAKRQHALLVPNAALRFKPQEHKGNGTKFGSKEEKREPGMATVYVLTAAGPQRIRLRPGITDNKFTEVLSDNLHAGDEIITDDVQANTKPDQSSSTFRMRMF